MKEKVTITNKKKSNITIKRKGIKKYIPKKDDVVIIRNGKYYNTISKRDNLAESTAKRYNSFFKRNPDKTIHEAWGGTKYKKYRVDPDTGKKEIFPVSEQKKLIRNLWYRQDQFVKTKNKEGKEVLYSPFSDTFLTEKEKKVIKKLDYTFLNGKVEVHLHRLSKDEKSVYHIITYRPNKEIKHEFEYLNYMEYIYKKLIPRLRIELNKIRKYHTISIGNNIFGQFQVHFYAHNDYIPMGWTFGRTDFDKKGIELTLKEMLEGFDYYYDRFLNSNYHNVIFENITIYIQAWSDKENIKYAQYRYGVKGLRNGF